jgi:hypothetical protein
MIKLPGVREDGMSGQNEQRKLGTARGSPRRSRTAKYWGKPAVRNDREDRGNVGIIRSPVRASILPDCLTALCILAKSTGPHRHALVEKHIDEYLSNDPFSLALALERLRRAIHYEAAQRRKGEDCSIARNYARSLLRRMT